jgi:hypothetical protein
MAEIEPVTQQEDLGSKAQKSAFSLRRGTVEDADALGVICYEAFKTFNDSVGIDYKMDFRDINYAKHLIRGYFEGEGESMYSVVAVREGTGQPLGSGFLHHIGTHQSMSFQPSK